MRKIILFAIAILMLVSASASDFKTYCLEGGNVNIRETPGGAVVGHADGPYTFSARENDGWVEFWHNGRPGYVSKTVLTEIEPIEFSSALLGDYMGNDRAFNGEGYSIGTLSNVDGYVVFEFTDYSQPNDLGLRNMMAYHLVGLPEDGNVRFTHSLSQLDTTIPLARQLEGNETPQTHELIADKDGNLYMGRRLFSPQSIGQSKNDVKLTERNLFDAGGEVKKITLVRAHPDGVIGASDAIQDFIHEYYFDPKGNIYAFYVYDIKGNGAEKNDFQIAGNHVDFTSQALYGFTTAGSYDREIKNYDIIYTGSGKTVAKDGEVARENEFSNTYRFNMNGQPIRRGFDEFNGPFFVSSFCNAAEYSEMPIYTRNPLGPTSIVFEYSSGGDSEYYETTVEYKEQDSAGNWTRRDVHHDGKPFCVEKRIIEYY